MLSYNAKAGSLEEGLFTCRIIEENYTISVPKAMQVIKSKLVITKHRKNTFTRTYLQYYYIIMKD